MFFPEKINWSYFLTFLIITASILVIFYTGSENPHAIFSIEDRRLGRLELEIADNQTEREEGLMNRNKLEEGNGMLFVFPDEEQRTFWMKNTSIPLDIIYISRNGEVVDIDQADPQTGVKDENLKIYRSDRPAKYVIETNQNWTNKKGIEEGVQVSLSY